MTEHDPLKRTLLAGAAALLLGAVVAAFAPDLAIGGGGRGPMGRHNPLAGLELVVQAKLFLTTFNVVLLLVLTWNYLTIYRDLPNPFTGSLLLFSVALMFYALSSNPLVTVLFGYRGGGVLGPFTFLPDLFAAVAIVVLLYQSYR